MTLAGSLLLIYLKRINLARAVGNPAFKGEALEAEVAKIISIKTGTPALGLFAIGLILEIAPVLAAPSPDNVEYRVKGSVQVRGDEDQRGNIDIYRHFPPLKTTVGGSLPDDLRVSLEGKMCPKISLVSPTVNPLDLNDKQLVSCDHQNRVIEIRNPIVLTPLTPRPLKAGFE
jgi:hypothetical protein